MPTQVSWIEDTAMMVKWVAPLNYEELLICFRRVSRVISQRKSPVDVVFDINASGHIPLEAGILAIQSGFLSLSNTRNVCIFGLDNWAQFLARSVVRATGKPITFYATYEEVKAVIQPQAQSAPDALEPVNSPRPELPPVSPAEHE